MSILERYQRGDKVRTPMNRPAVVQKMRADGRYDLGYLDMDGGEVALAGDQLELVKRAPRHKAAA